MQVRQVVVHISDAINSHSCSLYAVIPEGRLVKETKLTILVSVIYFIIMAGTAGAQTIPEEARRHLARGEAAMEMAICHQ